MSDANLELMRQVFVKANGGTIRVACRASSVPESFLAALVAGESGGDFNAKRFEPAVLVSLWQVLLGRKAHFGSIGGEDILAYISKDIVPFAGNSSVPAISNSLQRLDSLATSWGLTQIMGYNAMALGKSVDVLRDPTGNLDFALAMLTRFAAQFHLDVTADFEQMFRCWNTGQPDGTTADPNYVANGLARMQLWPEVLRTMGAAPVQP